MNPSLSAKSLILTVLHAIKVDDIAVQDLIEIGRLLAISANSVRVALSRLLSQGKIEKNAQGRYCLSASASFMREYVHSWRKGEKRLEKAWSHDWVMCRLAVPAPSMSMRNKSLKVMSMMGFECALSDIWLRPNNLTGGIVPTRERAFGLGLETGADVAVAGDFASDISQYLESGVLWDIEDLDALYEQYECEIHVKAQKLARKPSAEDVIDAFIYGYYVIRALNSDPLLPYEIHAPDRRIRLTQGLLEYESLGRKLWDEHVYHTHVS